MIHISEVRLCVRRFKFHLSHLTHFFFLHVVGCCRGVVVFEIICVFRSALPTWDNTCNLHIVLFVCLDDHRAFSSTHKTANILICCCFRQLRLNVFRFAVDDDNGYWNRVEIINKHINKSSKRRKTKLSFQLHSLWHKEWNGNNYYHCHYLLHLHSFLFLYSAIQKYMYSHNSFGHKPYHYVVLR